MQPTETQPLLPRSDSVQAAHLEKGLLLRQDDRRASNRALGLPQHQKNFPAEDVYVGPVPAGCSIQFLQLDVKYLVPKEFCGSSRRAISRTRQGRRALWRLRGRYTKSSPVSWIENRSWSSCRRRPTRSCRLRWNLTTVIPLL